MTPEPSFKIDMSAIRKGGAQGGAYLLHIGKTDMKTMTVEEWEAFCQRIVIGTFGASIIAWTDEFGCNTADPA